MSRASAARMGDDWEPQLGDGGGSKAGGRVGGESPRFDMPGMNVRPGPPR